jgi:hypothetical protein
MISLDASKSNHKNYAAQRRYIELELTSIAVNQEMIILQYDYSGKRYSSLNKWSMSKETKHGLEYRSQECFRQEALSAHLAEINMDSTNQCP